MGGNVKINDALLRARAAEIRAAKESLGEDYTSNPITDAKTGAIFTYKKDENGQLTCSYKYHNEKKSDIILFQRTTVPTSRGSLGYLNDAQFEEFKENHPGHFYTTEYAAGDESRKTKEFAEQNLNHYDKKTRKSAEQVYRDTVATEFMASGTYDKKSAKKLAKFAMNDAKAGLRADYRESYMDKDAYKAAKKELDRAQKAAKKRIDLYKKTGRQVPPEDEEILKRSVEYIKDKDVRKYVEAHPDRFYENGKFSSEKYRAWAESQLQGDNTLTTSERKPASIATTLSEKDTAKAVKYAGFDAQKDHVMAINTAKSLVGLIAGPLIAYCTNSNIHSVQELAERLEIVADSTDPSKFQIFLDGVMIQEQRQEVLARFRDVAVRNAILASALATVLNNPWVDPAGARDRKAEGITAATISEQNIFRGKEVTDIEGQITIDGSEEDEEIEDNSCYEIDGTPAVEAQEATPDEDVFNLRMNQKCNVIFWYQTADAYQLPEGFTKRDIYNRIRELNGDPDHDKYPPSVVGLPKEITIKNKAGKEVTIQRLEKFNIKGRCYEPTGEGKKRGTGSTYVGIKGKPGVAGKPGNYHVKDCETGKIYVDGLPSEDAAMDWIEAHKK
ncbi:MAG: hypothetical protein NC390_00725 [Fusobacterium sp.]|nr:hypothetical protein [Fusobacterium sp.]